MKVYFLTYADDRFNYRGGVFRKRQIALNESAQKHGIENLVPWTWDDMIKTDFYRQNKAYLDKNRFHNGAVFKPYIILELLERIEMGDVVFYHDCGPRPITTSVLPLINLCVKNGGTVFHQWGDQNRHWTKRDAFVYMDCDSPRYHDAVALQNTWLLLQKSDFALQFTREWLKYNLDERIASYVKPDTCGLPPLAEFVENRGDQAIFSVLAAKYGIKSFYGHGAEHNRDVNEFMRTIPRNVFEKAYWLALKIRRKLRRRRYVTNYISRNMVNYLRGDIPAELRDSCYLTMESPSSPSGA